jgi:CBS domain containing-hemolysin-like protein
LDEAITRSLIVIAILIAVHAGLEFSYSALINVRRTALRERSEGGDADARRTLKLSDNLPYLNLTTQFCLLITRFAIITIATASLIAPLVHPPPAGIPEPPFGTMPVFGYLAVLVPLGLLLYAVGTLIPATYGAIFADQAAPFVSSVMRPLVFIFSPLTALFIRTSRLITRAKGEDLAKSVTEEEIIALVDVGQEAGTIESEEKEMIYSVLQFGETMAREVMVPRPDITALQLSSSLSDALAAIIESGHSRIPVYEDDLDDIKGLLYAKDLLAVYHKGVQDGTSLRSLMRPAYYVPETKRADALFKELQQQKVHIAIVVDEYGSTAGVVTIEDLIEEIVGDIRDEYDVNEEADYVQLGAREYVVDGGMNISDLNELMQIDLDSEENDSVGGFVYSYLGRVPNVGEAIELPDQRVRLEVDAVENRRIRKIHIARYEPPEPQAPDDAPRATRETERVVVPAEASSEGIAADAPVSTEEARPETEAQARSRKGSARRAAAQPPRDAAEVVSNGEHSDKTK